MTPICDADIFPYAVPFQHRDEVRKGLIVALKGANQRIGWGEIAPLPHWSQESLDLAEKQIKELLPLLKKENFNLSSYTLYPSVHFGLESAIRQLNNDDCTPFSLPINGLLQGSFEEIVKTSQQLKDQHISTVKLKVSSLSFKEAKNLINYLKDHFILRIDVNRSWSFEESKYFFSQFNPDAFEYIEEPIKELDQLKHFPFPFALDESLKELLPDCFQYPFLKAVVIKPTMWGDLSFLHSFKKKNIKIVLSSSYETGIGIYSIAQNAKHFSLLSHAHGLDTGRYLTQDLLFPSLEISRGQMYLPSFLNIRVANV